MVPVDTARLELGATGPHTWTLPSTTSSSRHDSKLIQSDARLKNDLPTIQCHTIIPFPPIFKRSLWNGFFDQKKRKRKRKRKRGGEKRV